ncbi:MAG: GAF domain-containing protein [Desulfobacterales bacterium]|nr:GAF domain-containing protein [Desulfobacterales bacterium]
MGLTDWITMVTAIVTALSAVIGVTVYITRKMPRMTERRLREENARLTQKHAELKARHREILERLAIVQRTGSAALVKKTEIDTEISVAKKCLNVAACSILVPYPPSEYSEFVFLSIDSERADTLRKTRIPLTKGIAGYVFAHGTPYSSANVRQDSKFFDKVDARSGFKTKGILCLPIQHQGRIVGVMQFLNKIGNVPFDDNDLAIAERFAASLAPLVAEFCLNPDNFEILGITPNKPATEASILVCDLTNSVSLTGSLPMAVVTDILNEYLEKLVDVGLSHGATVDKCVGDGFSIRFNVPRPVQDHRFKSLIAALEMRQEFVSLRRSWIRYGFPAEQVYSRIAIESGPVYEMMLGHPLYRQYTVLGEAVIVASNLCESAERTRDVIVIGQDVYENMSEKVIAKKLPQRSLGKANTLISAAYELIDLKIIRSPRHTQEHAVGGSAQPRARLEAKAASQ